MLLIELVMNSTTYRISNEEINTTINNWQDYLFEIDPPQYAMSKTYGGYLKLTYGNFSLRPSFFKKNDFWPPPRECDITVYYTATDEASKVLLFGSKAYLEQNDKEFVSYKTYDEGYSDTISNGTVLSGTLAANFLTWCTILGLNLVEVAPVRTAPTVAHTVSGDHNLIDFMDEIASFFCYSFYIRNGFLYLIDMNTEYSTPLRYEDGYDYFINSTYRSHEVFKSADDGTTYRYSAYYYGRKETVTSYDTNAVTNQTNLDYILTFNNTEYNVVLKMPITGLPPEFGRKIILTDASLAVSTDFVFFVRGHRFDFLNEEITIWGEGDATFQYLLLESGDFFLLEDGSKILLESGEIA